jgi:hypothetical protein
MGTRFLPLHPTDTAYWTLVTCPVHTAGDLEIKFFIRPYLRPGGGA